MSDFRGLQIDHNLILPSSGLLRGVWWFKTDVSGLPIDLIFRGSSCHSS